MECFDDIPEDKEEGYQCPKCFGGNVTLQPCEKWWSCDECDFGVQVKQPPTETE